MVNPARGVALLLAFLFEIGALVVVAVALGRTPGGVTAAILGVVALGGSWGLFAAPHARWPLTGPILYGFLTLWFGTAMVALWVIAGPWWAIAAAVVLVGNVVLIAHTGGRPSLEPEAAAG